jgi:hypothetical protein
MHKNLQAQPSGQRYSIVRTVIVDKDPNIHCVRQLSNSCFEGFRRIVCGHDYRNPFTVYHLSMPLNQRIFRDPLVFRPVDNRFFLPDTAIIHDVRR